MAFVFANNVNTTLAAPITTTTTTSITLTSSANLPSLSAGEVFALTLCDAATQSVFEVLYATAISGAVLTVQRGQEGTTANTWLSGDYAYAAVTAGILESFAGSAGAVTEVIPGTGISVTGGTTPTVNNAGVLSVGNGAGISSTGGQNPTLANTGVLSVNGETGALAVSSSDSSITVGGSGTTIDLKVSASAAAVGACIAAHATFTAPASQLPLTATLPTLPGGGSAVWYLECFSIGVDFSGSGSGQNATLTGGGSGVTWYGNSYYQQPAYTRTLMIVGQAPGGTTPSVTLTGNGSLILVPNSTCGYVTIKAIRVS